MPQTMFQKIVFSVMMSVMMVLGMETYNLALGGGGLTNHILLEVWGDVPLMACIVFLVQNFIGGPLAGKLASRLVTPGVDKPILVTVTISACTVMVMCPLMSLIATLLFKSPGSQVVAVWLQTMAVNFPMALCWQIFYAGPLVRLAFRSLFRAQLRHSAAVTVRQSSAHPVKSERRQVGEPQPQTVLRSDCSK